MLRPRTFRPGPLVAAAILIALGLAALVPEPLTIPVSGATPRDWNHDTFWHHPWGASGVHRGIDIFAPEGTPAVAPASGIVTYAGTSGRGGRVVLIWGAKWRMHYLAHLQSIAVRQGQWITRGEKIGTVGTTGNAAGKPPHLHYAIRSVVPYPWRVTSEPQGIWKAFYLNPHHELMAGGTAADTRRTRSDRTTPAR